MAFSLGALPNETIFVECRAFVFLYHSSQWSPVRDKGVYSRVQLLCQRTASTSGTYRIYGRLETSGYVTLDVHLQPATHYTESEPTWHLIQDINTIYGLRISPDSNASRFALVIQNTIRSMQVGPRLPPPPTEAWTKQTSLPGFGNGNFTPYLPGPTPVQRYPPEAATQGQPPETPIQRFPHEVRRDSQQQSKRLLEQHIEQLCNALSGAIQSGDHATVVETSKKLSQQKVALSIKLKNPTHIPVDPGIESVNLRVIVEDKEYSGGAFTMKVAPSRKIQDLQREVFDRYGFPVQVQKWIVGQRISQPNETLSKCGVKPPGATVFLYLVSGASVGLRMAEARRLPARTENASGTRIAAAPRTAAALSANAPMTRTTSMPVLNPVPPYGGAERRSPSPAPASSSAAGNVRRVGIGDVEAMLRGSLDGQESWEHHDVNSQMQSHTTSLVTNVSPREAQTSAMAGSGERLSIPVETNEPEGWQCPKCTLINVPTRPGCEVCSAERPTGYVVPNHSAVDEREHVRMEEEQRQLYLFEEADRDYSLEDFLQTLHAAAPDVEDGPQKLYHPVQG